MNKRFLTWEESTRMWDKLAEGISKMCKPDMVVGLARGGLTPAVYLSHKLGVPMEPVTWTTRDGDMKEHNWNVERAIEAGKNVVFVDDINDSGVTLEGICKHYDHVYDEIILGGDVASTVQIRKCIYAVMLEKKSSKFEADLAAEIMEGDRENEWIQFPWEGE